MRKNIIIVSSAFLFLLINIIIPLSASAQTYYEGQSPWDGQQIRQWRDRSNGISTKINKLDDQKVDNVPLPILFGLTPDNLTPNFGDPRVGHTHEGLDIMAPRDAMIVSPTDAVVLRVDTGTSSGNYVSTANPGGETFVYMHLDKMSELKEGDELDKGDLIGYVGNTGNAAGGPTHLHFEIHNSDGDPTDPFPRIKSIFPMADKIDYLQKILDNADDEKALAEQVVTMYRKDILLAQSLGIDLPSSIEKALETVPVTISASTSSGSSSSTLNIGSHGAAVIALQKFLIGKGVGTANLVVSDGAYGPITKQALKDYQVSVGLVADGVYGPKTRAYVEAHS